jgi:hypothetical protein
MTCGKKIVMLTGAIGIQILASSLRIRKITCFQMGFDAGRWK